MENDLFNCVLSLCKFSELWEENIEVTIEPLLKLNISLFSSREGSSFTT